MSLRLSRLVDRLQWVRRRRFEARAHIGAKRRSEKQGALRDANDRIRERAREVLVGAS